MNSVNIGICGLGTVGGGTFNVLRDSAALITARAAAQLRVIHVGARHDSSTCDLAGIRVSRDIFEVARDPEVDILVELIGGTTVARELVEAAIIAGKHVVTANKALIAEFGNEIFALAEKHGVEVRYEAAIAGGIPIVKALRDRGREFADVLSEAQALGYAEADPAFDVEGTDAAHKLVILASLAFGIPLQFDAVYTEGITELTTQDVGYASELGYVIKHLGIAKQTDAGIELRVHPTLIPNDLLLADVDGVKNAILVEGGAVGPTLYYGAGAGARPTASAVVADVIDLARGAGTSAPIPALGVALADLRRLPIIPIEKVKTPWYLRMEVADKPGVLSRVASIFSEQGISIEALIQRAPGEGQTLVSLIVLTNNAPQGSVDIAVSEIEALETIKGKVTRIRVEALDG